jgi:NAD+ diphosphatase
MGFYCDVTGDTTVTLDGELASAIWVDRSEIKGQPDDMSLTNEMMMVFRDGKEPK